AFKKFYEDKDNKALVELVGEAFSDEVFFYGGSGWGELLSLYGRVNNASQLAMLADLLSGGDGSKASMRATFEVLRKNKAALKVPELVIGFRIKDAKKAERQLARLEKILGGLAEDQPGLKGRFARTKVGDSSLLTFTVDAKVIPPPAWD